MNQRWIPWVRLAWAWGIAVILCLTAAGLLIWQTSGTMGRAGLIQGEIDHLNEDISRLQVMTEQARKEREEVADTSVRLDKIDGEVFGRLDDRLTAILREIGAATRDAGLLPKGYTYRATEDKHSGDVRFGIGFSVEGTYEQVRSLIESIQASKQFLIIESIGFKGEEDARTQNLAIQLQLATFLVAEDLGKLQELIEQTRMEQGTAEGEK